MKMYIAVLDSVPAHMVPVLVAHSVLGAHLHFNGNELLDYNDWLDFSFKKCVVKVNQKEFEKIKALEHVYQGFERTVLNAQPSCLVVCPRNEYPNVLKFAKLWTP
jgi:hypothetical protein